MDTSGASQGRRVPTSGAGYSPVMERVESHGRPGDADPGGTRGLRRIIVTAGLVLVGLILIVVAIYAGAFIILAPMMQ